MLINLSNHPSAKWPPDQLAAAKELFGEVEDWPFPNIDPRTDSQSVTRLSEDFLQKIIIITHEQTQRLVTF